MTLGMYAIAVMKLYSYHIVNQWSRIALTKSKKRKKSLKETPPSSPKTELAQKIDAEKLKGEPIVIIIAFQTNTHVLAHYHLLV